MKKVLLVLFLCAAIVSIGYAQDVPAQRNRKVFMGLGLIGSSMGEFFIGGGASFGFYPSKNNLLMTEVNVGFFDAGKIGNFYYNTYYPYKQHEGDIDYSYTSVEVLFSWNFVERISRKIDLRFGPSLGILSITGSESFYPTTHNGRDIGNLPDPHSETKTAFAAGIGTGIAFNFFKGFFLDLGYRFMVNSGITFEERTMRILESDITVKEQEFDKFEHQFSMTAGWRF
jgi:opacity protein-like surface antigen